MGTPFERVYVINLRRRADRLHDFRQRYAAAGEPFGEVRVFDAIEGNVVGVPDGFTQGGGAFGCRQSHVAILQQCLMDDVKSVLIFEDDASFADDFAAKFDAFFAAVPDDWKGLMIGGQHHAPPKNVNDHVVRVQYAQRTHAYAARPAYMRALVKRWALGTVHIDWMMNGWQHAQTVYAPTRWLVCQGGGMSDINGRVKPAECWVAPEGDEPVLIVRASKRVVQQLRALGCHTGHQRDPATDYDTGLPACADPKASEGERDNRLRHWLRTIQEEVVSATGTVATIWHPSITVDQVRRVAAGNVYEVGGNTAQQVLDALPDELSFLRAKQAARRHVVLLNTKNKNVVTSLRSRGWHFGNWRDKATDMDNGLINLFREDGDRAAKLRDVIAALRAEADLMTNGVVVIWHPDATADLVRRATADAVLEVGGDTLADVLADYEAKKLALENEGEGR